MARPLGSPATNWTSSAHRRRLARGPITAAGHVLVHRHVQGARALTTSVGEFPVDVILFNAATKKEDEALISFALPR